MIQGDNSQFSDFVSGLTKVTQFADDQQAVIRRLVDNLATLSGSIEGGAQYLTPIIGYISRFGTVLADWLPSLVNLSDNSGEMLIQLDYLLEAVGIKKNYTPDAGYYFDQMKPLLQGGLDLLALTPGLLEALNGALDAAHVSAEGQPGQQAQCSNGQAQVPAALRLYIREKQVTLCNP